MLRGIPQRWLGCLVLASGFLLRFLPLVLHHSVAQGDEIFQAPEQAHRLVFGYSGNSWEFVYGARSWILPLLAAGPMEIAKRLGGGPDLYLPLIAALFAAIGAIASLCVFLRARDFYSPTGAAAVAIASACWIDNMYFGARTMAEPLAAHLLIIAACLAGPGTSSKKHLALGGFLAAAAFVIRMQLAPAIALLWLWPGITRKRIAYLSLGAIAAFVADGVLDTLSWGAPFIPLWQNLRFNFILGGAAHFSVDPWDAYFRFLAYNWGASAVAFLALALLGARRVPMIFAMAIIIIAAHILIGHKEYRFIYPAIALLSVAAGFGLVEFTRLLAHGLKGDPARPAPVWLAILVGTCWAAVSLLNVIGRGFEQNWRRSSDVLAAQLHIARMPGICGVGFEPRIAWTGGYTYLHQRVPIYALNSPVLKGADMAPAVNVLVAEQSSRFASWRTYRKQQCFGRECIFLRPGNCVTYALPQPPPGPLTMSVVDFYTYESGTIPPQAAK